MRNSGSSSAKATAQPLAQGSAPARRRSFALTGRSVVLDPLTHAVRRDIADVRLAEYVFAPHYVVAMPCVVVRPATLRQGRDAGSEGMAHLVAGEIFEVFDIAGDCAWGIAVAHNLVGYVDHAAMAVA